MSTIRQFCTFDEIPLDKAAWTALVSAAQASTVFVSYTWVTEWWKNFGAHYQLFFLTVEEDGSIIAFAPLMRDSQGVIRFIADTNSDYLDFVVPRHRPDLVADVLRYLDGQKDQWSVLHLRNIPRSSPTLNTLSDQCGRLRLPVWNNYSEPAPYLAITGNSAFVDKLLSKYSIRRGERLLEQQGELRFAVIDSIPEATQYWPLFVNQHIERCKKDNRRSSFEDPAYLSFLKSLFESEDDFVNVHFSVLLLDEHPIAFHFGFVSDNCLLWYKPCFDIHVRKGSPGVALISNLIRYAVSHGLDELDFTIGREAFKDRLSDNVRLVDSVRIYRSRVRYQIEVSYWALRERLKIFWKKSGQIVRSSLLRLTAHQK